MKWENPDTNHLLVTVDLSWNRQVSETISCNWDIRLPLALHGHSRTHDAKIKFILFKVPMKRIFSVAIYDWNICNSKNVFKNNVQAKLNNKLENPASSYLFDPDYATLYVIKNACRFRYIFSWILRLTQGQSSKFLRQWTYEMVRFWSRTINSHFVFYQYKTLGYRLVSLYLIKHSCSFIIQYLNAIVYNGQTDHRDFANIFTSPQAIMYIFPTACMNLSHKIYHVIFDWDFGVVKRRDIKVLTTET